MIDIDILLHKNLPPEMHSLVKHILMKEWRWHGEMWEVKQSNMSLNVFQQNIYKNLNKIFFLDKLITGINGTWREFILRLSLSLCSTIYKKIYINGNSYIFFIDLTCPYIYIRFLSRLCNLATHNILLYLKSFFLIYHSNINFHIN
jgi:hypothetical protein